MRRAPLLTRPFPPLLLLIISLCFLSGCAFTADRLAESDRTEFERRCRPVEHVPGSTLFPSLTQLPQLGPSDAAGLAAATGFSPLTVEAAHAFDVLPLLIQMPALERAVAERREGAKEALQDIRSRIVERILLASFQTNGVNAEITCEAARAEQLADYLQEKNDSRARLLTVIAVVAGGVGAIAVGGFALSEHSVPEGTAGIIGGVLSTAFGSAALFQGAHETLKHPRNLLREIWEGPPTPTLFPDVIWRFLNRPLEEDPSASLRTVIIERWRRDGRLGRPGSALEKHRIALMFGDGGDYNVDDLRARAQMYNMLQTQVALTSEYLEQFLRELLSRPTK